MKKILSTIIVLFIGIFAVNISAEAEPVVSPVKKTVTYTAKPQAQIPLIQNVSPIAIVDNPKAYLNKKVMFSGEFVSFTSLGLDYKPAFRDSQKYIGVLMKRPDVKNHTIPLSELKMFMTRELAEKNIDIDTGDTFMITGKVFSTALGDPWLDITEFKITNKKAKTEEKNS